MSRSRPLIPLVTLLLACLLAGSASAKVVPGYEYVPGEIIVKFRPGVADAEKHGLLRPVDGTRIREFRSIDAEYWQVKGMSVEEAVGRLESDPRVEYAQPNYLVSILETPNDTRFSELWGLHNTGQTFGTPGADIKAVEAWDTFTGTRDVVVAVIDTGVDYNHPDLAANIWTNPGEIPGNGIDDDLNGYIDDVHGWDFANNDSDPMDDHNHGTHCAGTIGAVGNNGMGVAGVNWNVSIMPMKFLTAAGNGSIANAVSCIEYATMMGVDVMSNSWGGGPYDALLEAAIGAATAADIFVVVAAGNAGMSNDVNPHYPSSLPNDDMISVMATNHFDARADYIMWASNYGATSVDIAAPGVDILSTTRNGTYSVSSGTSMATPHVAGALALLRGRYPGISAADGKHLLMTVGSDPLPSLNNLCVSGARLNLAKLLADPDVVPPGDVIDLAIVEVASNRVGLQWTAPGDDGAIGTCSSFDLRWSLSPITDAATWDAAVRVAGEPVPGPVGTVASMQVTGLDVLTSYHFAVRAKDEYGNLGGLSNPASATTLEAPSIAVAPTSLSALLQTGDTASETLTITNTGQGVLDFSIGAAEYMLPAKGRFTAVPVFGSLALAKGETDPRQPIIGSNGAGGPDAFGYNWRDSDDPAGPAFNWIEINTLGTAVSLDDDTNSGPLPLSFPFPFYGVEFNAFRICSNGWLSFTATGNAMVNGPLPSPGAPLDLLALFWDDLDPSAGGQVYWYDDGTRLIVEFENVPQWDGPGLYTMQAHLYPDGVIEYHYLSMGTSTDSGTVGIQNGDGTDGLTVAFDAAYVRDNLAVRFTTMPLWLSTSPSSGSLAAGASTDVTVQFSAGGLCGNHFDANLHVVSNDPAAPDVVVAVGLDVIGTPDLAVSAAQLDFGSVYLSAQRQLQLVITNRGCTDLTVTDLAFDHPDFSLAAAVPLPLVLPVGGSQVAAVVYTPTTAGPASGALTLASDDTDTPMMVVALAGLGLHFPDIAVTPSSLTETVDAGGTSTRTLTIANNGPGDLNFTIPGAEYLEASGLTAVPDWSAMPVRSAADQASPRFGAAEVTGVGGPDGFGYQWKDSDEPGGPAYNWIEIEGIGTPIAFNNDEQNLGPFPIGFDFPFYGTDHATFQACSNGWLSFTSTATGSQNHALPSANAPLNLVAAFHDDLTFVAGGQAFYHHDGARLIVEYKDVPRRTFGGPYTFQIHLYPTGRIEYHYQTMLGARLGEATVGIQNADGTVGLTAVVNAPYVRNGLAVRFLPRVHWLSASPVSGTVPPGASLEVTVGFDTVDLCGDEFRANLHVLSNDPDTPDLAVPVTMNIPGEPDAVLSSSTLDFGAVNLNQSVTLPLRLANAGGASLTVSGLASSDSRFTVDIAAPFVVGGCARAMMNVTFTPTTAGVANGTLTFTTDDPGTPVLVVALNGQGVAVGQVTVSPASIHRTVALEGSASTIMTISNGGTANLDFSIPSPLMYTKAVAERGAVQPETIGEPIAEPVGEPGAVPLGAGGPDPYGYEWIDSDEPGGPVFNWIDIRATGTVAMANGDDANAGPFPIGFPFEFYGNTFTTFRVGSNGFISFTSTWTSSVNRVLPGTTSPRNLIAPFWDDLNLNAVGSGDIYYQVVGGNLVVMYDRVMPKNGSASGTGPFTFEVILTPAGEMTFQYLTMTGLLNSHTVGIQDATGTVGLSIAHDAAYVHDNLAVTIRGALDWLSCDPVAGTVPPGGSLDVAVNFDATGLAAGLHEGSLRIISNDPLTPEVTVAVTMLVSDLSPVDVTPLPRLTLLEQNVPNPFNPQTTINFSLPGEGRVELRIYDVRGALVRSLVEGTLPAGRHSVIWQGLDDREKWMPSGVYYYRLRAGSEVLTRRMTMIR